VDEENDVDMKKTMWLVLRKSKPTNETLKEFYAETYQYPIRIKDIIKFGRVNFKVSALSCSKLDSDIQGTYEEAVAQSRQ
jgi:RING-variant domain/FHA domain